MVDTPIYHVTFLRHGESVGNAEARFQGHADYPLTEKGLAQARALAARWVELDKAFDQAFSSPLLRARQTAEIVTQALHIPLEFDDDLKEINNGLIAGLTEEEALRIVGPAPAFMTPYTHYGRSGESRWELYLRAGRFIQHLLDRAPGRYLVVAHGGILSMIHYAILNIPLQADYSGPRFSFENTTFSTFTYEPERHSWRMLELGNRQHWKDIASETDEL